VSGRIIVTGGYGAGNLGDDLLATVTVATLRNAGADVLLAAGDRGLAEADLTQHRSRLSRVLSRDDLLLLGGGGLFNDEWALDYSRYFTSLALVARARGARASAAGIGVEPLRTTAGRCLLRVAAQVLRPFGVRDPQSLAVLRRHLAARPALGTDLGWLADDAPAAPSAGRPVVAVTVAGETQSAATRRLALLEQALRAVMTHNPDVEIRLICIQTHQDALHDDRSLMAVLADRLSRPGVAIIRPTSVAEVRQALEDVTVAVGYRLHGLLLAYLSGAHVVAISRSEKVARTFHGAPGSIVVSETAASPEGIAAGILGPQTSVSCDHLARGEFIRARRSAASDHLLTMAGML
jgi:polysaccharide pyruvyl transferase WcaK-like protein